MIEKRNITCIICPMGCSIGVALRDGKVDDIVGNRCSRGVDYSIEECTNPVRTLTSTVKVIDGDISLLPVKSSKPLPKEKIMDCMQEINRCIVKAPIKIGDIIINNILGTGINIIATGNVNSIS